VKVFIVGIAGGTGSGKTSIVQALRLHFGSAVLEVVEHDSYYKSHSDLSFEDRRRINYDHPDALETELLVGHLDELHGMSPVQVPTYDFSLHLRCEQTRRVEPKSIIVVEGILTLCDADLRSRLDLSVFVDTAADIRLIRRLRRDQQERGRSVESTVLQYLETVRPMHEQFVAPSRKYADLVVRGDASLDAAVQAVETVVKAAVARESGESRT
jgi:uridine kinase